MTSGAGIASVAGLLSQAMDRTREGLVVCDSQGALVFRNAPAEALMSAEGDLLATRAIEGALQRALAGSDSEEALELYYPSRRSLEIKAFPLAAQSTSEQRAESGGKGEGDGEGVGEGEGEGVGEGDGEGEGEGEGGGRSQRQAGGEGELTRSASASPEHLAGAVALIEDVSDLRRLEAVRRDFVANLSHELKTPLGALSLLAETLDGEEDPEVVTRLTARIGDEARRFSRLVDDLLDLSRIEAGATGQLSPVPLAAIVDEATEGFAAQAASRGIRLEVRMVDPEMVVMGSRRDLTSAVANLVDNAIKYSDPGGSVDVSATKQGDHACVFVRDHGVGIPKRDQERIFERFYRVDRARSRWTGGTGLGLAIVRHIAAYHGGDVTLESTEGEGSTFTLCLPLATEPSGLGGGGSGAPSGETPAAPIELHNEGPSHG